MQPPPPQAGPPGTGGPPRMGMGNNGYWRKRGPNPVPASSASVQPVTDPFAFGRMTPQSMAQGSAQIGNPPSVSPSLYPQPIPVHASGAGDQGHGSLPGSVPQPSAMGGMYTNVSAPSPASAPFPNYPAATVNAQPGPSNMQTFQNTASGLENAFLPVQSRPQSTQSISYNPPSASPLQHFVSAPSQPTTGSWGSLQSAPPVSAQNYPLSVQQPSHNAPYYSPPYLEVSNLAPRANETPGHYPPTTVSNPTFQHSYLQPTALNTTDYMHSHNPEQNWFNQPYKDQRHPPLPSPNPVQYPTQPPEPHQEATNASSHASSNADSGTISMFFKGGEEENVEIVSSEQQNASVKFDHGSSHYQNAGHQGVPSLLPQPTVPPLPPISLPSGVPHVPVSVSQNVGNVTHPHSAWRQDGLTVNDKTNKPNAGSQLPYDNAENVECVQNQEVPPNEPSHFNLYPSNLNSDMHRYGSMPGPSLTKNVGSQPEAGPNIETPETVGCPVRSDSVSSNYSNLSHKSLPVPTRPPELAGTFIQKESGRLEGDSSHGFFKQIDSSPMVGDALGQNMGQHTHHSSLSQPPTPSPPKPTGIFMTSANSSFEPVRSHSIGLKAPDIGQLKMGGDVREGHKVPPNASVPAAFPGNLEQPPDNLETIFLGKRNSHGTITSNGNLFQSVGEPPLDNISLLLDKRPSSRAHGSNKKCESPATTLWAQGELPNFGGNVLLAPAAPSLYVPPKTQTEIIQPPEDGSYDSRPDLGTFQASPEEQISSENLENPPKIGDEEQLPSQASSGYASLLSSPPTEALQNQPLLIAQPNQTYNLSQPINFSLSLPNQVKNINSFKEVGAANDSTVFSLTQGRPEASNPPNYKSAAPNDKFSESLPNQNSVMQRQSSANQAPLNLAAESQKAQKVENATADLDNKNTIPTNAAPTGPRFPANPNGRPSYQAEKTGALDFTVPRAPVCSVASNIAAGNSQPVAGGPLFPGQSVRSQNGQAGLDVNKQGFYQQVTKDGPPQQPAMDISHQGGGAPQEYMVPSSQPLSLVPPAQAPPGGKPISYPPQAESQVPTSQNPNSTPYNTYGPTEQPPYPAQPVPSSSAPVNLNNTATYQEQPRPPASHNPQQADPYYYYRSYGAYQQPYPQPYQPLDPRAAPLYYPDPYAAYDPTYRQYSGSSYANPAKYPYQEPERPSSRSSHCSDRPSSRQGYSSKGDWNAQSGYYPGYYQNQYDYADPTRWDRYPGAYDPGYRDPRSNYWNYMYNSRDDAYQRNVPDAYTSRYDVYEDRWQYDPRYVGGFDDEPRRDPTKDDFDRRSVHSEHSVHSMHSGQSAHSRRSSFSSHSQLSQHSQIYKSQPDLTASAYEPQIQNPPLNEYSYGVYPNDYSTQQALDNYSYGYTKGTEWQPVEQVPSRPLTPEKFGSPHICARFGPGGQLIKVLPNLPSDGQPALVEIHNMEVIMQNSPEQEQLRSFPGPLVKDETHKVDVINFAQKKSKECFQNESLLDQESSCLLWDFIVLLCRQNGTVVGTDIAELLLRDHKTVWLPGKSPNEANLIDFSNEPLEHQQEESGASQLSFLTDTLQSTGEALQKENERFRELLLFGRKKDALESAMKSGLWGHALLLASKMDSRTHARVMTRFANSLPINDPLQTVYQLLSGRMPAAATCCGDEKWGDWRPHLAMVLSNLTSNVDVPTRAMTTMGDTLASRGLMDASHFCYLMAQVGFGIFTKKSTKLVLIGSNHSLTFAKFCTNEAIQRTEAYEYAQSLGTQSFSLPNIQVYKFIYACRLAEHGLSSQAFHYCEVISKTILKHPSCYSPVLVGQLLEVSSHLRFFDPQLKEKPEQELFIDPPWLQHLRTLDKQMKHGTIIYDMGRTTPQQFACSTPSSEMDQVSQSDGAGAASDIPTHTDNPLLASLLPNMMPPVQAVLVPAGPENPPLVYPPYTGNDPSYPGTPQGLAPSSGPPTPATAPNFVPFAVEQAPLYPPAALQPYPPPPQATDYAPPMQMSQDPGLQRIQQNSPTKNTFPDPEDFYGVMAKMGPGQRSRTVSMSSTHMRRTRTTSESSTHSIGSGRRSSMGIQPSPPPASIPEADRAEEKKEHKPHGSSQGSGRSWFPLKFGWLMGKGKNEAHLPDDRNKSIVWDEKKQRWVNQDEPEEESKPLPPPPPGMPKKPQTVSSLPGGPPNPSVNVFSIRAAGARGRYVDVLNPGGTRPTNSVPPPADLFAPLAPMSIPTNLFVPNAVPEEDQHVEASAAEMVQPAGQMGLSNPPQAQMPGLASLPPGSDLPTNQEEGQMGELSRSSSLSSLSREVSQHMEQAHVAPASGPPPTGAVPFYNPSQFAQQQPPPSAPAGGPRPGRLGQRKYPSLK